MNTDDITIPDEAVTAAARALNLQASDGLDDWGELTPGERRRFETAARRSLQAALPVVLADRQQAAEKARAEFTAAVEAELDLAHRGEGYEAQAVAEALTQKFWPLADRDTETAGLRAALDAVTQLHREFRIFDECGHPHTVEGDGVIYVENVGFTCEAGYEYSICRECCTDGSDYQTEECVTNHGRACWPCRTHEAAVGADAASLRGEA